MARVYYSHLKFLGVDCKMAYRNSDSPNYKISCNEFGYENILHIDETLDNFYDVIFTCVEPCSHLKTIEPYLKNAKLILSEKPVSLDINEIKKFLDKKIFILMNRRFYDWVSPLKNIIKSSQISKIIVEIPEKYSDDFWYHLPKSLPLNSIHIFDLISYLTGGFTRNKYKSGDNYGFNSIVESKYVNEILFNISFDAKERFSIKFYNKDNSIIKCCPIEKSYSYKKIIIKEPSFKNNIREYIPFEENFVDLKENLFQNQKPGILELCQNVIDNYEVGSKLILPDINEALKLMNWIKENFSK